ncbi:MAG: VCBS repeat-containing protein, partial [Myxococcales bacterium]|nr:VCBS repeat-containing protein [Myxococcales bacterium]
MATHGAIPGGWSVGIDGSASYAVSLQTPPGRGGVTPSLSLSYSSNRGLGDAGVGWALGGLSEVRPCSMTLARDGKVQGVRYDSDDVYCLDGQRLVQRAIHPAAGGSVTEYRTVADNDARITSGPADEYGPTWFRVEGPSGGVSSYRTRVIARQASRLDADGDRELERKVSVVWLLDQVTDASGNYATYEYEIWDHDGDEAYVYGEFDERAAITYRPTAIRYSGHAGADLEPRRSVRFVWSEAKAPANGWDAFVAGVHFAGGAQLLSAVEFYASPAPSYGAEVLAWKYVLEYGEEDEFSEVSRSTLTSLSFCDATRCLPPTRFGWETPPAFDDVYQRPSDVQVDGSGTRTRYPFDPGYLVPDGVNGNWNHVDDSRALQYSLSDFDGDGVLDVLYWYGVIKRCNMIDSAGVQTYTFGGYHGSVLCDSGVDDYQVRGEWWIARGREDGSFGEPHRTRLAGDAIVSRNVNCDFDMADYQCEPEGSVGPTGANEDARPLTLDLNRDGFTDLVSARGLVMLSDGRDFRVVGDIGSTIDPGYGGVSPDARYVGDFDGDGYAELVTHTAREVLQQDANWVIRQISGDGSFSDALPLLDFHPIRRGGVDEDFDAYTRVTDWDGDGLVDLLHPTDGPNRRWYVANGEERVDDTNFSNLLNSPRFYDEFGDRLTTLFREYRGALPGTLVDLNGDGLLDQVATAAIVDTTESDMPRGRLYARLNTGRGFGPFYQVAADFPLPPAFPPQFYSAAVLPQLLVSNIGTVAGDFNGDGRDDLLVVVESGKTSPLPSDFSAWLYLSDGRFLRSYDDGPVRDSSGDVVHVLSSFWDRLHKHHVGFGHRAADVDGDGLLDLVYLNHQDSRFWTLTRTVPGQQGGVASSTRMVSSENGLGRRDRVRYERLSPANPRYEAGTDCESPQVCHRSAGTVVAELVSDELSPEQRSVEYFYGDYRSDVETGSIGFGWRRVVDVATGAVSTSHYDVKTRVLGRYPFAAQSLRSSSVAPVGDGRVQVATSTATLDVRETDGTYRTRTLNSESRTRLFAGAVGDDPTIEADEADSRTRVDYLAFDDRFRALHIRSFTDRRGGMAAQDRTGSEETHIKYEDREDPISGRWLIGLTSGVTSISEAMVDGVTERATVQVDTVYDERGRPYTIVRQPDSPEEYLRSELRYDDVGNRSSATLHAHASEQRAYTRSRSLRYYFRDPERMFVTDIENALSHLRQFAYEPLTGGVAVERDEMGISARSRFDVAGRVYSIEHDGGPTVRREFRSAWLSSQGMGVVEQTGGRAESRIDLDRNGRALRVRSQSEEGWATALQHFDALGRVRASSRPYLDPDDARFEQYEYDLLNRMVRQEHPDGSAITVAYGADQVAVTDEEGRTKSVDLDAAGRLASERQRSGIDLLEVSYVYGAASRLRRMTDPEGNVTEFEYDQLGRVVRLLDPTTGLTTKSFTAFGDIWDETFPDGRSIEYRHDVLGRRVQEISEDGLTAHVYDAFEGRSAPGRHLFSRSPDGVESRFEYAVSGQPTANCTRVSGTDFCLRYQFDSTGRVEQVTYPRVGRNLALRYTYAPTSSRLLEVRESSSNTLIWRADERDAMGRVVRDTRLGGMTSSKVRDRDRDWMSGLIVRTPASEIHRMEYGRDKSGFVTSRDWVSRDFGRKEGFEYDGFGRMEEWYSTSYVGGVSTERHTHFEISPAGRLESRRMERIGTREFVEDVFLAADRPFVLDGVARTERTASGTTRNLGWTISTDDRGRATSGQWGNISYTEFDLPRSVVDGGRVTSFEYDAMGRRVRKLSGGSEVITIGKTFERRTHGSTTTYLARVYAVGEVVAELSFDSRGRMTPEVVFSDHLGSPVMKTDMAGAVVDAQWFGPFGQPLDSTGRPRDPSPTDDSLGYTGHRHDPELGWVDMGARIYDPVVGRFLTPDPIRETFDPFGYAAGAPLNFVDPMGTQTGPPERPPVIEAIERAAANRHRAGRPGEHTQTQPPGECGGVGRECAPQQNPAGESRVEVQNPGADDTAPSGAARPETNQSPAEPASSERPPTWPFYGAVDLDELTHSVTTVALEGLDRTAWRSPTPSNIGGVITRHAGSPGAVVAEGVVAHSIYTSVRNAHVASDENASTGERAEASFWVLLDVLTVGGAAMAARWGRGATAINQADDTARGL